VISKTDAEGLDPCEVTFRAGVVAADEVGIDMEVGVREDTKVLILPAMEVEVVAIAAGEAGVTAGDARIEVADLSK
jgi:hypothetical protein